MVSAIGSLTTGISYYKNSFLMSPMTHIGRSKRAASNDFVYNRSPNIQRAFGLLTGVFLFTSGALAKPPDAQKCFANVNKTAGVGVTYSLAERLSPLAEQNTLCKFLEINCFEVESYFDDFYTCSYTSSSELTVATFGLSESEYCVYENITKPYCQSSIQYENSKIPIWPSISLVAMGFLLIGFGYLYFRCSQESISDI